MRFCALVGAAVVWFCGATVAVQAQSFLERWQERATETQSQQPHWATPVATSTPKIDQAMRAEFVRQTNSTGSSTWNLGNNKGLELIPERHTEIIFGVPPFFDHSQPHSTDGFGDLWFQAKYRLFSRNEQHGNAAITAVFYATVPTGKHGNGSCCAVLTPTIAAGKGFGRLVLMSTLGGALPLSNADGLGRTIQWNGVAQYRVGEGRFTHLLAPEIEFNSSFLHGGPNDGRVAVFGTPGLVVGRIPLSRRINRESSRRALSIAAGEQIALTHYHNYSRALILSVRLPF